MTTQRNANLVRDWMIASVPTITPRTTIATALRLLRDHALPALPVVSEGRLLGLVSEIGLLRFTPSEATPLDVYEIHEALDPVTVVRIVELARATAPDRPLHEAGLAMLQSHADVIPVVDDGHVAGMLTSTAFVAAMVREEALAASTPAA
jgi:acetoin utilization protein AcuB